jgi:hypothetical protein
VLSKFLVRASTENTSSLAYTKDKDCATYVCIEVPNSCAMFSTKVSISIKTETALSIA